MGSYQSVENGAAVMALPGSDGELGVEWRHAQDEVEVVPDAVHEVLFHVVPGFLLSRPRLVPLKKKTSEN